MNYSPTSGNDALLKTLGVMNAARLIKLGYSRRDVEQELANDSLVKVRRGWYVWPDAPSDIVTAIKLGGQLTGTAGLKIWGCWVLKGGTAQVAVQHHARARVPKGVSVAVSRTARTMPPLQSPIDCVSHTIAEPFEHALVAIDSGLHLGLFAEEELESALPSNRKARALLTAIDGTAESGLESLVRFRLARRGVKVRPQMWIDQVGRVDMLVGDRLVIECDGATFHNNAVDRTADYARDRRLYELGFIPWRLSYQDIVHNWQSIEPELLNLIRRRSHRSQGNPPHATRSRFAADVP